jgi:hypothetical protein
VVGMVITADVTQGDVTVNRYLDGPRPGASCCLAIN